MLIYQKLQTGGNMNTYRCIYLPYDEDKIIREYSAKTGISASRIVREALKLYLTLPSISLLSD